MLLSVGGEGTPCAFPSAEPSYPVASALDRPATQRGKHPTVPSQPTTLSQMGTIGGCLGRLSVPSRARTTATEAPLSSKPGRFD
jgi:hypothetical protein